MSVLASGRRAARRRGRGAPATASYVNANAAGAVTITEIPCGMNAARVAGRVVLVLEPGDRIRARVRDVHARGAEPDARHRGREHHRAARLHVVARPRPPGAGTCRRTPAPSPTTRPRPGSSPGRAADPQARPAARATCTAAPGTTPPRGRPRPARSPPPPRRAASAPGPGRRSPATAAGSGARSRSSRAARGCPAPRRSWPRCPSRTSSGSPGAAAADHPARAPPPIGAFT